jgi:hypothetical protein
MSRAQQSAWRDSVYAQAIADQEGPRVSIRAEFSNATGTRRARALFNLEDDAYVLIGHIDADGVLRVVFPTEPNDEGFVKGNRSYQTNEFYAGFVDQYRYRAQTFHTAMSLGRSDSYDGGLGYMFIIASWRPMRFDRFQTEGTWDSFEMTDDDYLRDPRPAIYELASLLVGENREAYTVKFARYSNTQTIYTGYNSFNSGFRYCLGYQPFGFASDPTTFPYAFGYFGFGPFAYAPGFFGYTFNRRGTTYTYDSFGDCYRTSPVGGYGYYGTGYRIASAPQNLPKRPFDLTARQRPFTPRAFTPHPMPTPVGDAKGSVPAVSANYRQRGLITTSDEPVVRGRREPRSEVSAPVASHARPTIQEMVTRRPTTATDRGHAATDWSRQQARAQAQDRGYSAPTPRERTYDPPSRSSGESRSVPSSSSDSRGSSSSSPRMSPPPAASPPASSSQGSRPAGPPSSSSSSSSGSRPRP